MRKNGRLSRPAILLAGFLLFAGCASLNRVPSAGLTPEEILEDLRAPRVKDVVIDSDTFNEMDDQYAIAYALASEKMRVLALHAAPFYDEYNDRSHSVAEGMELSYKEIGRVLEITGNAGKYPVFKGATRSVTEDPDGFDPENPAARNLVRIARKAKQPVYVLCLGMITNVAAALMLDPSIKEKIVVVWLGTNCFSNGSLSEFNLRGDYRAGQLVMNSGVPLVVLPASGKTGEGTQMLSVDQEDVKAIRGNGRSAVFFRSELPHDYHRTQGNWWHILWDIAAPGLIAHPEFFNLRVIPAPVLTDDWQFAFDSSRHRIVWMDSLDPDGVRADLFRCISLLP